MGGRALPRYRLVKAFNTICYQHLAEQGDTSKGEEDRRVISLDGDDVEAHHTVAELVRDIGFGPLDTGDLSHGGPAGRYRLV